MAIFYTPYPAIKPPGTYTYLTLGDWWVDTTGKKAYKLSTTALGVAFVVQGTSVTLPPVSAIPPFVAQTKASSSQ